jgi:hypothetical protein
MSYPNCDEDGEDLASVIQEEGARGQVLGHILGS